MGESKRLSDGSYIDADYVWDATEASTQAAINAEAKAYLNDVPTYETEAEADVATNILYRCIGSSTEFKKLNSLLGGNTWMIIQFYTWSKKYGAQIAFGFSSNKIAIRNKQNSTTWNEWQIVSS